MDQKSIQPVQVVALGSASVRKALRQVSGCEHCSALANTPFESVIRQLLGAAPEVSSYVLGMFPVCPNCDAPIIETTRVQLGPAPLNSNVSPATPDDSLRDWYDPPLEETDVVFIDERTLLETEALVACCESCAGHAEINFDYLLDEVTGCDPTRTEYVMCRRATCPGCSAEISEKTLVIPA